MKRLLSMCFILASLLTSCGRTTPEIEPTRAIETKPAPTTPPEKAEHTLTPSKITLETDEDEGDILGWKVHEYEDFGFEILVPDHISVIEEANGITLVHAIPHEHPDPCDFRGTGQSLEELTDFQVNIEVVEQSLFETVNEKEYDTFASEYVEDNELLISPGFIDEVDIGLFQGYRITMGVEGCGAYIYYFPLNSEKTLYVKRSFITEFMPIITNYQDYLALPGIITPAEEEELFIKVLSSLTLYE